MNIRDRTKHEPVTEEDHDIVKQFEQKEKEFKDEISQLKSTIDLKDKHHQEVHDEWLKLQMQGSELEKVERNHAELEFSLREKKVTIK